MKTIFAYKARQIGDKVVEDVQIKLNAAFPNFKELPEATSCFIEEGNNIEKVLRDSLPGGTYDQLLVAMLTNKASHFVVVFGKSA